MARHQTIDNPATGERYTFLRTSEDTGGALFVLERRHRPGGLVAEHVHPLQEERFEVVDGEITFRIEGRDRRYGPGEVIIVAPGVRHAPRNESDRESTALIEFRPALDIQGFFETFAGLARDGRTNRLGVPRNPLRAAVAGHEFRREVALASPPLPVQRLLRRPAATVGRALGYRARDARWVAPLAPAVSERSGERVDVGQPSGRVGER
jgi:quercetin dioxygenase-like cupin family protein